MAPFDGPALAAANDPRQADQRQAAASTAASCRSSPATRRTTSRPRRSRVRRAASARERTSSSSTCDVDFATPVVQEAINRGDPRDRTVHRHRPDGAEALRRNEGQAGVQLRQRRPGRGLGDGGGARGRTAGRAPRSPRTRCSSTSRTSCRRSRPASSSSAARSSPRRATSRSACDNVANAVTPAERRQGRRDRDVDRRRSASCRARLGAAHRSATRHADAELVGR